MLGGRSRAAAARRPVDDAEGVHDLIGLLPLFAIGRFEQAEVLRLEQPRWLLFWLRRLSRRAGLTLLGRTGRKGWNGRKGGKGKREREGAQSFHFPPAFP